MRGPVRALLALAIQGLACTARRGATEADRQRLQELRENHERLRTRLAEAVARDPFLGQVRKDPGTVILALRGSLLKDVVEKAAAAYLDRVSLDLPLEARILEAGEVKTKTFLGTLKAGDWKLDLRIHRVQGVLRGRKPKVDFVGTNRLRLRLTATLEAGRGSATARFAWDASGVANVLCRDFDLTRKFQGLVLPQEYPLEGVFRLSAGPKALAARPESVDRNVHLLVDLTPESWAEVRSDLESQDRLLRCGIAVDPEGMMARLKALGAQGFDVTLPSGLLRAVTLPASLQESVRVLDREVEVTVESNVLRLTKDALWYSLAVRSRVSRPAGRP